jgi:hypothetical protein
LYKRCSEQQQKRLNGCVSRRIGAKVLEFLAEDDNTRMCPGKRDYKSRSKKQVQKRVLLHSMKFLHNKFVSEEHVKVSYRTFCRLKPFWIVKQNDRDTCLCVKHSNFKMCIDKLHQLNLVSITDVHDVCAQVCCDQYNEACMTRQCDNCKEKDLGIDISDERLRSEICYFQWRSKSEMREIQGRMKEVRLVEKSPIRSTIDELIKEVRNQIPSFLKHVYYVKHQYEHSKFIKENLKPNEAQLQIDFSENYVAKYATEIQSMHFGASKKQISLHTGVMHYRGVDKNVTQNQSFCTVSENVDHGAHAVWAHMKPVFKMINDTLPNIDTLHILSDGPTAQYKNRFNINFMMHFIPTVIPHVLSWTWNFGESGHGKGPMDGVGGVLKRTADTFVQRGTDITSSSIFVDTLTDACPGVKITEVPSSHIAAVKKITTTKVPSLPGIMQVHQVTWASANPDTVTLRTLSCHECSPDQICTHYSMKRGRVAFPELHLPVACIFFIIIKHLFTFH